MEDRLSKQSGVYKWTFPNGKVYIGKARNFSERYKRYISDTRRPNKNYLVIRALRKYGIENCLFNILKIISYENPKLVLEIEASWIRNYNSVNIDKGYNLCEYSTDWTGRKHSSESINKMKLAQSGHNHPRWNKKISEETKKKISTGQKIRPELKIWNMPINQLDKNNNLIKRWDTFENLIDTLGHNDRPKFLHGLRRTLRKQRTFFKKYKWEIDGAI